MFIRFCGLLLTVGLAGFAAADEEILTKKDDDRRDFTLLRRQSDSSFVHQAARVSFVVPADWQEIRPHRLDRKLDPRTSTVLGIERAERDMVATIYWLPMNPGAKLSDWVRDMDIQGEFGEEYEVLKAVYGRERVTTPERFKRGPFEVYKITIQGGPDRGNKYNGTLYLFEVGTEEGRWLVKVRVSYPRAEKNANETFAEEVLKGFDRLPDPPKEKEPGKL